MMLLEMSRDEEHGGGDWAFPLCLWSPVRKDNGSRWPFWELVGGAREDDVVLHLRGDSLTAAFVGYSRVSADGRRTSESPPAEGEWSGSTEFFRTDLDSFVPLSPPIPLRQVFQERRAELESYFDTNKASGTRKKHIFFVRQAGRLQCLNGAYLSEVDDALFAALFGGLMPPASLSRPSLDDVATGTQLAQVMARRGQREFADRVKEAYGNVCCFPGCDIADRRFLVASHIARWSDNESMRGRLENGLCLCVIHDKAFELGLFTLDDDLAVRANSTVPQPDDQLGIELAKAAGRAIRTAELRPIPEALAEHRRRVGAWTQGSAIALQVDAGRSS